RMLINLKPKGDRSGDIESVVRRLSADAAQVHGITLYLQPIQDLTIETRVARTQYQFTLQDSDLDELNHWVPLIVERLRPLPEVIDVASDREQHGLQAYVNIDRDTAGRLGVTPAAVDAALYNAFGQRLISTIFTQSNQYRVVLEVGEQFQDGPQSLNGIY